MSYILIAEDNPDAATILTMLFEKKMNLATKHAPNGRKALDMVAEGVPNLIMLDLMMPELNGFQVLAKLWSDKATRDVPVIVVSGVSNLTDVSNLPNVKHAYQKAGFSILEIERVVRDLLTDSDASVAATATDQG